MAAVALLFAAAPVADAGSWNQVPIELPLPAKLDTDPGESLLVARFRATDHDWIDVGLEISRWMRRQLARTTALDVLDVPPPPIPEQRPAQLAVNDVFWRRLGNDFQADLIVAGVASYQIDDRSGYVTEDVISNITGQTVRQSRFAEMTGFRLRVEIFFLKGDNGALLHNDVWQEETVRGEGNIREHLEVLFELLESMADDLSAVFLPTRITEPRFIWVE
ncbi:MAG: hypothetical protein JSV80_16215 [Acidobacteriota bacterium]|nr:MAG: hypothetical protein JSV80_16215 [Acidobacteriota bacterium]